MMDEKTQRLVEHYGLDREAHEMHHRVMHQALIKGLRETIEREKNTRLAKFISKNSYRVPFKPHGSDAESNMWHYHREKAEIYYLQQMLKTWKLKDKNKQRVAGLAAYKIVHASYREISIKESDAQKLLELNYSRDLAQEIIREWKHLIDYYFDRHNDI